MKKRSHVRNILLFDSVMTVLHFDVGKFEILI